VGQTNTSGAAFFKYNLSSTDPTSAATIDAIFTSGFDVSGLDLAGLYLMLQNLEDLSVNNHELILI
jgi:hypothetical protein